ncbi:MAG TPA: long-chain fatty acid--CoA ligase [Dermatophilaceae bacterium]|nr:long-chain fatty acid--CoA ligase [Dermatophilaceae bacterium]
MLSSEDPSSSFTRFDNHAGTAAVDEPGIAVAKVGRPLKDAWNLNAAQPAAQGRATQGMAEYGTPPTYVPSLRENLSDDVFTHGERAPDEVGFSRPVDGRWIPVTYRELAEEVTRLAAGLIVAGIQPGDRIALCSHVRFEWMLCDFAIWAAAGVTVPIYETSSAEQVEWILADSGAVAAFVETPDHAKMVAQTQARLPGLSNVWVIDSGGIDALVSAGRYVPDETVMRRRSAANSESLATIIYTSGTTGRPKGCAITHANLLSEMHNVCAADGVTEVVFNQDTRTLHFLPLAHILARSIQLAAVHNRVHMAHTSDVKNIVAQMAEFRPTSVLSVPRVFEKIYNTAKHTAAADGKGRIFDLADATAVAYSRSLETGGPGLLLRLRHGLFDRLVYGKLRAVLGGDVSWSVSGGAALGARLGHFYRGIGITVLEGYGLTETCAGVTLNLPDHQRVGSVGRPIPGCTIRIGDDGEVLIKGGNVFAGYWHNDEATREVFDQDGWFHSGDLGELDADGYLTITGRKKDIIVTSSGKNVAPMVLEDRLRAHWLVSQCVVIGDARPFIGALVTIDPDAFTLWKDEAGKPATASVADLREDPDLLAALQIAVDDANKAVSDAESIKKIRVLITDFTEGTGELTPTLKVKRHIVLKEHDGDVESIYRR